MDAPTLQILQTADAAAEAAADHLTRWIEEVRAASGRVHLALTGGLTPRDAYARLVHEITDWSDIHLWFGDERLVPPTSQDSNAWMARGTLIDPAGVPDSQVHQVRTELELADAVNDYTARLRSALPEDEAGRPVFDIVMLGLGEDGHIASLFPARPQLEDLESVCVGIADSPKPPPERVSLGLATINAAHRRLVLTAGSAKAEAVRHATQGTPDPLWPASLLEPRRTVYVVDEAAAADIGNDR